MAEKYGICMNLECDNYKKVIEVEPGAEFVCPQCGMPLKVTNKLPEDKKGGDGKKSNGGRDRGNNIVKRNIIIVSCAAIVVVILLVLSLGFGDQVSSKQGGNGGTNDPGLVTGKEGFSDKDAAGEGDSDKDSADENNPDKDAPGKGEDNSIENLKHGTVDLGYAVYTGDLKNGKPHGYGNLVYKKSMKIVESKDFVAKPGDEFEGEFREGKISAQGYWKHDGNETVVKP